MTDLLNVALPKDATLVRTEMVRLGGIWATLVEFADGRQFGGRGRTPRAAIADLNHWLILSA
jgi:hypothetical protein